MGKKRKLREKAEAATKSDTKKKDNVKSGQTVGLSGRELFSFNPTMAGEEDDDEEGSAFDMTKREAEEDDGVKVHDIKFDAYGIMDDGVDESTDQQLAKLKPASQNPKPIIQDKTFGLKNKKGNKQQQFIAQVQKQVQSGGNPIRRKDEEARIAERKAKEAA